MPTYPAPAEYILSRWLLLPCFDAPAELFTAGLLAETDPMPEAEALAAYAAATYASEMADIDHENEPVRLSLDRLDTDGIGISQQSRTLRPIPQLV